MRFINHNSSPSSERVMAIMCVVSGLFLSTGANGSSVPFQVGGPGIGEGAALNADLPAAEQRRDALRVQQLLAPFRVASTFQTADDLECPADEVALAFDPAIRMRMSHGGQKRSGSGDSTSARGSLPMGRLASMASRAQVEFNLGGGASVGGGGGSGGSTSSSDETAEFVFDVAQATDELPNNPAIANSVDSNDEQRVAAMRNSSHFARDRDSRERGRGDHVVIPFPAAVWMGLIGLGIVMVVRKHVLPGV